MTMQWTKPYYGITHLKWSMEKRFRISASERCPTYSDAAVYDRESDTPFTPIVEFCGKTLEDACRKAQTWAEQREATPL